MPNNDNIKDFADNFINDFISINEKVVGQDISDSKIRLAKDDKGAWINHMADQYLKTGQMDQPPEELQITKKNVIAELAKRELNKIFRII